MIKKLKKKSNKIKIKRTLSKRPSKKITSRKIVKVIAKTAKKKTARSEKSLTPKQKLINLVRVRNTKLKSKLKSEHIVIARAVDNTNSTTPQNILEYEKAKLSKLKKQSNYLQKKDVEFFKQYFANKKDLLLNEMNLTKDHLQSDSINFPDQTDRATQEEEFSIELRTRDRERNLLKKIEHSTRLLEKNQFGFCESCGDKIGRERLLSRPEATLCIQCKSAKEREERQTRHSHG
ncbi:MAG: RNA polymerase-binding protein DksA [Methylacidiphilales bacterium]|nr:RNA polymerase-binding protein DksA [Candidatus Methylacidiphilales bacterium]